MEMVGNLNQLEVVAHRFKVLSEPARLLILLVLCQRELNVLEICDRTQLHQANVSRHLRLMKDAGVVACRRDGIFHYYRVIDIDLLNLCTHAHQVAVYGSAGG